MMEISRCSYTARAESLGATIALGNAAATMAGGGAVGGIALSSVVIPMALVALGIGGVSYVANNTNIIETIVEDINTQGRDFIAQVKSSPTDLSNYIRGYYKEGKFYLSETLLKIIAESGLRLGLFDGLKEIESVGMIDFELLESGESINFNSVGSIKEIYQYMISSKCFLDNATKNRLVENYGKLVNYFNIDVNKPGAIQLTSSNYVTVFILPDNFLDYTYRVGAMNVYNGVKTGFHLGLPFSITMTEYEFYNNHYYEKTFTRSAITCGMQYSGATSAYASSIGINSDVTVEGIPVSDNIPNVVEGDTYLPTWVNPAIDVAGDVALPVDLPTDVPLVYPVDDGIAYPIPSDIVIPDTGTVDWPANPPATPEEAQADAQDGEVGVLPEIPLPPQIDDTNVFNSFLVPESIKKKFPFSLPYDIYDIFYCIFCGVDPSSSSGANQVAAVIPRTAPRWEIDFRNVKGFEQSSVIVIDLAEYNEIAMTVRIMMLAAVVIDCITALFAYATGGKK